MDHNTLFAIVRPIGAIIFLAICLLIARACEYGCRRAWSKWREFSRDRELRRYGLTRTPRARQ